MIGSYKNWPSIVLCCLGGVRGTGHRFGRFMRGFMREKIGGIRDWISHLVPHGIIRGGSSVSYFMKGVVRMG